MAYPKINSVGWKFRETFDAPASVINNGGIILGGDISDGVFTPSGDKTEGLKYCRPDFNNFINGFTLAIKTNIPDLDGALWNRTVSFYKDADFSIDLIWKNSTEDWVIQVNTVSGGSGYYVASGAGNSFVPRVGNDTWVIASWDGTDLKLYYDTDLIDTDSSAGAPFTAGIDTSNPGYLQVCHNTNPVYQHPLMDVVWFDRGLTADELEDFINGTTFTEVDDSQFLVSLPLRTNYNDGSDQVTENIGSLGGVFKVGDGSDVNTFPTQLFPKGMEFGNGEYLMGDFTEAQITGDVTFGLTLNVSQSIAGTTYFLSCTGASESEADNNLYSMFAEAGAQNIRYAHEQGAGVNTILTFSHVLATGIQHIYMVRDTTAKTVTLYVDGQLSETLSYASNPTGGTNAQQWVSSFAGVAAYMNNNAYIPRIFDSALTETQVKWLYQYDINLINQ